MFYSKEEILKIKRNGNLEAMEKIYYEDDSDRPNFYIKLEYARMLIQNRRLADAKKVLKELIGTNYDTVSRFEFGRIAVLNKDYQTARDHFYEYESRCTSQYDKDKVCYEIARLEYEAKNYEKSKKEFLKLIDSNYDGQARLFLGRIFYAQEEYLSAQKYLYPLLNTRYCDKAKFELGKIEFKNGNIDLARDYFLDCANEISGAYFELGKLEFCSFNYEKAKNYFRKANYSGSYLAKAEYCLGEKEEAIKLFKSLLGTKNDVSSRLYLSLIYIKNKDYDEAYKMIHTIIDSNEIETDIKFKIILILSKELNIYFKDFDYTPNRYYTYSNCQYIDYNSNNALEHIFANHIDNPEKNNFNKNIDVCNLFDHIGEELNSKTLAYTLMFNDSYFIDYPNIGSKGENILKVVTLPGTKKVITMYPVESKKYFDDVSAGNNIEELIDAKRKILLSKLSKIKIEDNLDLLSLLSSDEKKTLSEMFGISEMHVQSKTLIK